MWWSVHRCLNAMQHLKMSLKSNLPHGLIVQRDAAVNPLRVSNEGLLVCLMPLMTRAAPSRGSRYISRQRALIVNSHCSANDWFHIRISDVTKLLRKRSWCLRKCLSIWLSTCLYLKVALSLSLVLQREWSMSSYDAPVLTRRGFKEDWWRAPLLSQWISSKIDGRS